MNRSELVRRLVLREISDDYENIDQIILRNVAKGGARFGLTIDRAEVVNALAGLIEDGLAKAYDLTVAEPASAELPGMPAVDVVEEDFKTYFYITKEGLDFYLSDKTRWPFGYDDEPVDCE
jgi:hypothetical protein